MGWGGCLLKAKEKNYVKGTNAEVQLCACWTGGPDGTGLGGGLHK